ncbi:hypothetical protein D3C74_428580 [compost metagenome]
MAVFESARQYFDYLIARRMAECVIDFLKPVQVEKEQCIGLRRISTLQQALEFVHKIPPVRNLSQAVIMGQLLVQPLGDTKITGADTDHTLEFTVKPALVP